MDKTTAAQRGQAPKQIEWNGDLPLCDICKHLGVDPQPAPYDVPTTFGPWGNVCTTHIAAYGRGISVGFERIKGSPAVGS